jgi:hypothetical protein
MLSVIYAHCDIHPFLLSVIMLIVVASLGHKCALIVIVSLKHIFLNS